MFKKKKKGKGLFDHLKKEKKGLYKKKEGKVDEWTRIKREITPYFIANNIFDHCELQLNGCNNLHLGFAHSKKRRKWAKNNPERDQDARAVVRACQNCHYTIEYIPKELGGQDKMYEIVMETIRRREERLNK